MTCLNSKNSLLRKIAYEMAGCLFFLMCCCIAFAQKPVKQPENQKVLGPNNNVINVSALKYSGYSDTSSRTIQARLQEELWVEDFRDAGESDFKVWQDGIAAMKATGRTLNAGEREYVFGDEYLFINHDFKIVGHNTSIRYKGSKYPKVNKQTPVSLDFPTESNPGPLRGCAFYFSGLSYYSRIEGIDFIDFRFALAFLQAHNSPTFKHCKFLYCDCGVICYNASQNYQFISCDAIRTGVFFIGSATCYPKGSPYSGQDNYYTDGLTIKDDDGHNAFSCEVRPEFDDWFRNSILRPSIPSFSTDKNLVYPYAENHVFCNASGRVVYVPMRAATRNVYGLMIKDIDCVTECKRGIVLANTGLANLVISGRIATEGVQPELTGSAFFTIGSVISGTVDAPFLAMESNADFIKWTHRGNGGLWDRMPPMSHWFTGDYFVDDNIRYNASLINITGLVTSADNLRQGHIDVSVLPYKGYGADYIVQHLSTAILFIGGPEKKRIPLKDLAYDYRDKISIRIFTGKAGTITEKTPLCVQFDEK